MKAKFIYETMDDILKGKSEKEIMSSLENTNLKPDNLLIKSSKIGFLPGVKKALEMGADVHFGNDLALRRASEKDHSDIVELLIKNGADVHVYYDWVLRYASSYGYIDVIKVLLKNGADVRANNSEAYRRASEKGYSNIVELLKKYMNIKESLSDILKPKSEKQIKDNFLKLYGFNLKNEMNLVESAFKVIQSSSNYIITSKLGFYYEIYGFQFESTEPIKEKGFHQGEIGEYVFGFEPQNKENDEFILIFENSGSDNDQIKNIVDFIRVLEVKSKLEESSIFKPKSKNELMSFIPHKVHIFLNDLYKLVQDRYNKECKITSGMEFFPSNGYGFKFKTIKNIYIRFGLSGVKQQGRFTVAFSPNKNKTLVTLENNDTSIELDNIKNLLDFLSFSINESIHDILKPKSEEEIRKSYENEYRVFAEIFYAMFPNSKFNLDINGDSINASFAFKETDKNEKEFTFLISQNPYSNFPAISYLDKSYSNDKIGGVFKNHQRINNVDNVYQYIKKILKE